MFDIIISGGLLFDGTGAEPLKTDIGIKDDTITDLGDLSASASRFTLHASRKYICPGFIDAHSHSDAYLLIEPSAASKIYQGITTEIVGNCGASAAPLVGDYHMPSDWQDKKYPGKWNSVSEYRELLEKVGPAPNVVLLIGHNTLRAGTAGYENRKVTSDELKTMKLLLEKSLDEGGRGLSTGLIYAPGMFAAQEELVELAGIVAKYDGIFTSHMRSESNNLVEAISEVIDVGRKADVRVEISHLKTAGKSNWKLIDEALAIINSARANGTAVCADRYPYIASNTELDIIFPDWAEEGGREAVLERLRNSGDRARIKAELTKSHTADYWSNITVGSTGNKQFQGMRLPNIAKHLNMEPVDAVLHLVEKDNLRTSAFFFGMSEENMIKILAEPYVMLGTDASLRAPTGPLSYDYPHPRAYGSFPRFIKMALDGKTVSLPEAIRKMTSLPAEHFKLKNRGVIAKGKKADIVIFDPAEINDTAAYSNPHQLAEGIDSVIINGKSTLSNGAFTGARAGKLL
ncbi:amidohydrolase family protein [Verrucomicrobiota bacterium]